MYNGGGMPQGGGYSMRGGGMPQYGGMGGPNSQPFNPNGPFPQGGMQPGMGMGGPGMQYGGMGGPNTPVFQPGGYANANGYGQPMGHPQQMQQAGYGPGGYEGGMGQGGPAYDSPAPPVRATHNTHTLHFFSAPSPALVAASTASYRLPLYPPSCERAHAVCLCSYGRRAAATAGVWPAAWRT